VRRTRIELAAVLLFSFVLFAWNIGDVRIASAYVDPIAPVLAQDESVYVHSVMRMAADGDWLTPKVLGRFSLSKPPLLEWLSAISMKLFGLGLLPLRLPSLLFGAIGVGAVFAWTAAGRSRTTAAVAALLLVSSPLWMTFSRLCYTDVLASALVLLAMYTLAMDSGLNSRRSRVLFGIFAGAAFMARSVVGILPFLALAVHCALVQAGMRPRIQSVFESICAAAAVALPWHVYQIVVHPQWFWADYVLHQLVAVGITEATGVTNYPLFYIRRLAAMEPVLCIFTILGAFGLRRAWPRRDPILTVALSWAVVIAVNLALFRGRSVSYLVLLLPVLCILSGLLLPRFLERGGPVVIGTLIVMFAAKVELQGHPWSLRYQSPRLQSAAAMRWYYAQNRDTELIVAKPDDEFYSMTLPHLRLRYCLPHANRVISAVAPHYLYLGIAVTAAQFADLPRLQPVFAERLSNWGLHSTEPVATAIILKAPEEIGKVMAASPFADFYLPAEWRPLLPPDLSARYQILPSANRIFLLARTVHPRRDLPAPLPVHW
jgi:4-amino-4-deoxy-L-arabinose transferase-like glycosyltransferase